ncbi:hypothetical protein R3P38DRAFT_3181610 [Favolaschia claudopus]|uniref:Reverse transcriptase n=1 Tax=Favolaschia claudopus TaxID=2862362 RepID=A0AAW0CN45_9AGAR
MIQIHPTSHRAAALPLSSQTASHDDESRHPPPSVACANEDCAEGHHVKQRADAGERLAVRGTCRRWGVGNTRDQLFELAALVEGQRIVSPSNNRRTKGATRGAVNEYAAATARTIRFIAWNPILYSSLRDGSLRPTQPFTVDPKDSHPEALFVLQRVLMIAASFCLPPPWILAAKLATISPLSPSTVLPSTSYAQSLQVLVYQGSRIRNEFRLQVMLFEALLRRFPRYSAAPYLGPGALRVFYGDGSQALVLTIDRLLVRSAAPSYILPVSALRISLVAGSPPFVPPFS